MVLQHGPQVIYVAFQVCQPLLDLILFRITYDDIFGVLVMLKSCSRFFSMKR